MDGRKEGRKEGRKKEREKRSKEKRKKRKRKRIKKNYRNMMFLLVDQKSYLIPFHLIARRTVRHTALNSLLYPANHLQIFQRILLLPVDLSFSGLMKGWSVKCGVWSRL